MAFSPPSNQDYYDFVRREHARRAEIRRGEKTFGRSASSFPLQERPLHFVGKKRSYVCGCDHPGRHSDKTYSVFHESRRLNTGLTKYLVQHSLESCSITDYQEYCRQNMADWETEDVDVGQFHYTSPHKDVVCRCSQPWGHCYGAPRDPQIIEKCAEFFCLYNGELMVTNDQWNGRDSDWSPAYCPDVPSAYSPGVRARPGYMPGHMPDSLPEPFYSTRYRETTRPPVLLKKKRRDATERRASVIPKHPRTAAVPEQQPDMPPEVWKKARPSLWKPQFGTTSALSTPMGSVPPTRPNSPSVASDTTRRARSSTSRSHSQHGGSVTRARDQRADSLFDTSSLRSAIEGIDVGVSPRHTPRSLRDIAEHPSSINSSEVYESDDDGSRSRRESPSFDYDRRYQSHPSDRVYEKDDDRPSPTPVYDNPSMAIADPVAELSARRSPVELPVTPARQPHTATLNELEGRDWNMPAELEGRPSRDWHQQTVNSTFDQHARPPY
jgi:hypothetical protein